MASSLTHIVFDCADALTLSSFWMEVLGYERGGGGDDWAELVDPVGKGPNLLFLPVPEQKNAKNRVHLDVKHGDLPAEVERLIGLGARKHEMQVHERDGLIVMHDPEGNEFCVYG